MNKKLFWYDNRKIIIASVLFFIMCFVILTAAVKINANDTSLEFDLKEGESTIDLSIHTELGGNSTEDLSDVGFKMAKYEDDDTDLDFVNFKFSDGAYLYESKSESQASATQMSTDDSGMLNIKEIQQGNYILYESEMSESNVDTIAPIYIKISKDSDEENKLKVSFSYYYVGVTFTRNGESNSVNIEIKHENPTSLNKSELPTLGCLKPVTSSSYYGTQSSLKITKEVYPPNLDEWEVNLKVAASLEGYYWPTDLTNGTYGYLSLDDFCVQQKEADSYQEYLKSEHEDYYNVYTDKYEEYIIDEYDEQFDAFCDGNSWYTGCSYSTLEEYLESYEFKQYDKYLRNTYNDYYYGHYDEYESELEEKYGDKYEEYLKGEHVYENVTLSKKGAEITQFNDSKRWDVCLESSEVSRSDQNLNIDIIEENHDAYAVSYVSNIAGLKQDGNRIYGMVRNALGHEIDVKVVNWDKNYGDLQITKKLFSEDKVEKTDKDFKFKVEFTLPNDKTMDNKLLYTLNGGTEYQKLDVNGDSTKSVSFNLKAGDTIRLVGIPTGTTYKVTEEDNKGYNVKTENENGTIEGAKVNEVMVINTEGNLAPDDVDVYDSALIVSKNVIGETGDINKSFKFTVTLSDRNINGQYGEMKFKNGVAIFNLKDGESIKAINIPNGTTYEVSEKDNKDFVINKENDTGTIENGKEIVARFTNMRKNVLPNTVDSIIIVIIVALISLGTLIYFQVNKKYMI